MSAPSPDPLAAGLAYKARGWAPIFYSRKAKFPKEDGWHHLRHSEADIRLRAAGYCNVGVILGPASNGLTDIDLDSLHAVRIARRFLPETPAMFGRRSKPASHWLYTTDLASTVPQAALQFKDPDTNAMVVELRIGGGGLGAQTMFPGSVNPEANEPVEWFSNGDPAHVDGDELHRAVRKIAAAAVLASRWAAEGGRHDDHLALTGLLARGGMGEDEAVAFVCAVVEVAGGEPDPHKRREAYRDARKKFESGDRKVRGFPHFKERFGEKVADRVVDWLGLRLAGGSASADEFDAQAWANPDLSLLGTGRRPAPAFPVDLLGPYWSVWVERRAKAASAPTDYVGVALLACTGAMIANVRWPVAGANWSEPPVLWCAEVGSPSSGKSPSQDAAFELVRHAEERMALGFDTERLGYETAKAAAKARREAWEAEVKAAVKAGETAPQMPGGAEPPEAPVRPRIRVADATVEALGALAAALPRGLLLVRDELSGWLGAFDKYGGGGSDRAFAIEMYGGRSYVVDRVKHPEPIRIRHLSIGVLGGVQPDKLSAIIEGPDDGLASRLLWAWPDGVPQFALAREIMGDVDACSAFARLANLGMGSDEFGYAEPKRIRLCPEAENIIEAFGREMAERTHEATGLFAGSLGKARGHALRLSAVLEHLWWCGVRGGAEPTTISAQAVTAAAGFLDGYFIPMAERVYGDASIPLADRRAMALARYLKKARLTRFNAREARHKAGGLLRSAEAMDEACRGLIEAGLIRPQFGRTGDTKGRVARNFEVNPALHEGEP